MPKQIQFRPNLTEQDITELMTHLPPDSRLYRKFAMFQIKLRTGQVSAAYTTTGAPHPRSTIAKLGLAPVDSEPVDHLANQAKIRAELELRAQIASELMSPADKLELLAQRYISGDATPEEITQGRALELEVHGANFGMFE